MLRSSDTPTTIPDTVEAATARLEDLARAHGRGSPALRDHDGSVVELVSTSAGPILTPIGQAQGLGFTPDGRVSVLNEQGTEYRDFRARTINATESIGSDLNVVAQFGVLAADGLFSNSLRSQGNVNADISVGAGRNLVAGETVIGPRMSFTGHNAMIKGFNGTVRCVNGGDTGEVNLWCASLVQTASERALKVPISDLDPAESLAAVRTWKPGIWSWIDTDSRGDGVHQGLYVDEVAQTDEVAIIDRGDGTRTYDDRAVIARLTAAVQGLAEEVDRLHGELGRHRTGTTSMCDQRAP